MISFRARIVRFMTRQYFKRISPYADVQKKRAAWNKLGAKSSVAKGVHVRQATIESINCEWLVPESCEGAPVLYYLHGGAYLMGSTQTHRRMVSHIARASGTRALVPNYRLAPEHRFPAAIEDSTAVYRSLLKAGTDPAAMAIAGDSAGGNLTMATLLALRDAGDPLPTAVCLMSPWLDLAAEGESMDSRAKLDPWFRPEDIPEIVEKYCSKYDTKNPLVSPVYADPSNLPPTLIQVGDHEILLSDSTRMADKISEVGGYVTLQIWPDMWHVFQLFVGLMPESKRAINDISIFLKQHLNQKQHSAADHTDEAA
jgi:acetyl esterase/lipase